MNNLDDIFRFYVNLIFNVEVNNKKVNPFLRFALLIILTLLYLLLILPLVLISISLFKEMNVASIIVGILLSIITLLILFFTFRKLMDVIQSNEDRGL